MGSISFLIYRVCAFLLECEGCQHQADPFNVGTIAILRIVLCKVHSSYSRGKTNRNSRNRSIEFFHVVHVIVDVMIE